MVSREERAARNQAIFRAANDAIERAVAGGEEPFTLLCECSDVDCKDTIELTLAEYQAVRAGSASFALKRAHEGVGDRVVEEFERYTLVEKIGLAREVAEKKDPRR
jgi:hypothetical protein